MSKIPKPRVMKTYRVTVDFKTKRFEVEAENAEEANKIALQKLMQLLVSEGIEPVHDIKECE